MSLENLSNDSIINIYKKGDVFFQEQFNLQSNSNSNNLLLNNAEEKDSCASDHFTSVFVPSVVNNGTNDALQANKVGSCTSMEISDVQSTQYFLVSDSKPKVINSASCQYKKKQCHKEMSVGKVCFSSAQLDHAGFNNHCQNYEDSGDSYILREQLSEGDNNRFMNQNKNKIQ